MGRARLVTGSSLVSVRALVGLAGVALLVGAALSLLASDDADRLIAGLAASGGGLLAAGAVAAWRRSWQRGRRRREAWGRLAWAFIWVALAGIVGAFLLTDVVVVLPAALGTLLLGSALLPAPSEQPAPPRLVSRWTTLDPKDGVLAVEGMQLAVPDSWSAFRVPDTDDYSHAITLLPNRRRLDLPIPILAIGRLTGDEAADVASAEVLVEQLRKPFGDDAPIEVTSARSRPAFVAGETALVLDVEARLVDGAIPAPRLLMAVGKAMIGIRPISARVYFVDRGAERWAIGWLGWSDDAARLNAIGESVVGSVRWQP